MDYTSENHSKHLLIVHLIFSCKYRKRLLVKYGEEIKDIFYDISKEWFFDRESNLCYVQKRFTEEEIKELENDGWVLENYRKIEVEDE